MTAKSSQYFNNDNISNTLMPLWVKWFLPQQKLSLFSISFIFFFLFLVFKQPLYDQQEWSSVIKKKVILKSPWIMERSHTAATNAATPAESRKCWKSTCWFIVVKSRLFALSAITLALPPQIWKKHMLTHTGEKPFKCKECKFAFLQAVDLKRNIWKHSGKKPFSCKQCDYSCTKN